MDIEEQEIRFAATLEALEQEHERVRKLGEALEKMPAQLRQGIETATREAAHGALKDLQGDIDRAGKTLAALQRFSLWRAAWQHAMVFVLTLVITVLAVWLYAGSPSELAARRADVATAEARLADLNRRGAKIQLSHCGSEKRLCVRVDESAERFGYANKDETYMIPEGY
jgi:hypothetical protein